MKRRHFLVASAGSATAAAVACEAGAGNQQVPASVPTAIQYGLNTSTISGQKLSLPEQVRLIAAAGYDAMEPWIRDLRAFVDQGGDLDDLRKQIEDSGLAINSAIGFAKWIVDDPAERAAGLEEARRDMEMIRRIGGTRIAAPPTGAQQAPGPPLDAIAERYRALLEIGRQIAVVPQLELWGFSKTLSRLSELAYVATAAEHPDACVLPDFYHIYKGGSDFAGLGMMEASRMHVFHINDYPADPPRSSITDAARVFPGDGVCPLAETIAMLIQNGFAGGFSLELFNPSYWKRDAAAVLAEGLEKTKAVVAAGHSWRPEAA